mmetsp:Transcript_30281/g.46366  ORF Transcript_30281/g.46366 Transcript_30281/m.46366 type:complete len:651 (+) Transcript_30281:239-2191(+)
MKCCHYSLLLGLLVFSSTCHDIHGARLRKQQNVVTTTSTTTTTSLDATIPKGKALKGIKQQRRILKGSKGDTSEKKTKGKATKGKGKGSIATTTSTRTDGTGQTDPALQLSSTDMPSFVPSVMPSMIPTRFLKGDTTTTNPTSGKSAKGKKSDKGKNDTDDEDDTSDTDPMLNDSTAVPSTAIPSSEPTLAPSVAPTTSSGGNDQTTRQPTNSPVNSPTMLPTIDTTVIPTSLEPTPFPTRIGTNERTVNDGSGNPGKFVSCGGTSQEEQDGGIPVNVNVAMDVEYAMVTESGSSSNPDEIANKIEQSLLDLLVDSFLDCSGGRRRFLEATTSTSNINNNAVIAPSGFSTLPYDRVSAAKSCTPQEQGSFPDDDCNVVDGGFTVTYPQGTNVGVVDVLEQFMLYVSQAMEDGSLVNAVNGGDNNDGPLKGLVFRGYTRDEDDTKETIVVVVPTNSAEKDPPAEKKDEGGFSGFGIFMLGLIIIICIGGMLLVYTRRRRSQIEFDGYHSEKQLPIHSGTSNIIDTSKGGQHDYSKSRDSPTVAAGSSTDDFSDDDDDDGPYDDRPFDEEDLLGTVIEEEDDLEFEIYNPTRDMPPPRPHHNNNTPRVPATNDSIEIPNLENSDKYGGLLSPVDLSKTLSYRSRRSSDTVVL